MLLLKHWGRFCARGSSLNLFICTYHVQLHILAALGLGRCASPNCATSIYTDGRTIHKYYRLRKWDWKLLK